MPNPSQVTLYYEALTTPPIRKLIDGFKTLCMTLGITTFSIITLSIKRVFVPLSINDTQHNNTLPLG